MRNIKGLIKPLLKSPWQGQRPNYRQRNYGLEPTKSKDIEKTISELFRNLQTSSPITADFNNSVQLYADFKAFLESKAKEAVDAKFTMADVNKPVEVDLGKQKEIKYYGPLRSKLFHTTSGQRATLVEINSKNNSHELIYYGQFRDGKPSGFGVRLDANGEITLGTFKAGIEHKDICKLSKDGSLLHIKNSIFKTKHRKEYANQVEANSALKSFDCSSTGAETYARLSNNKAIFIGNADLSQTAGKRTAGLFVGPEGRRFNGVFLDNSKLGPGEFRNSFGIVEKDLTAFDKESGFMNGDGAKAFPNNARLKGTWNQGIAQGKFTVYFQKDKAYKLETEIPQGWSLDKPLKGKFTVGKIEFKGSFVLKDNPDNIKTNKYLDDCLILSRIEPQGTWSLGSDKQKFKLDFDAAGSLIKIAKMKGNKAVKTIKPGSGANDILDLRQPQQVLALLEAVSGLTAPVKAEQFLTLQQDYSKRFGWLKKYPGTDETREIYRKEEAKLHKKAMEITKELQLAATSKQYKLHKIDFEIDEKSSAVYRVFYPKKSKANLEKDNFSKAFVLATVHDLSVKDKFTITETYIYKGALKNGCRHGEGFSVYLDLKDLKHIELVKNLVTKPENSTGIVEDLSYVKLEQGFYVDNDLLGKKDKPAIIFDDEKGEVEKGVYYLKDKSVISDDIQVWSAAGRYFEGAWTCFNDHTEDYNGVFVMGDVPTKAVFSLHDRFAKDPYVTIQDGEVAFNLDFENTGPALATVYQVKNEKIAGQAKLFVGDKHSFEVAFEKGEIDLAKGLEFANKDFRYKGQVLINGSKIKTWIGDTQVKLMMHLLNRTLWAPFVNIIRGKALDEAVRENNFFANGQGDLHWSDGRKVSGNFIKGKVHDDQAKIALLSPEQEQVELLAKLDNGELISIEDGYTAGMNFEQIKEIFADAASVGVMGREFEAPKYKGVLNWMIRGVTGRDLF